jgi:hypothetical protein
MQYEEYLFSQLFHVEFRPEVPYDLLFDVINDRYNDYAANPVFWELDEPEYESIERYLRTHKKSIINEINYLS